MISYYKNPLISEGCKINVANEDKGKVN